MGDNMIIFGDSIAWGSGESPNIGWAGRLKELHEIKGPWNRVYNLAIPGETSEKLLKHFEPSLIARASIREDDNNTLILALGINDSQEQNGVRKVSLEDFEKNISQVLEIAQKNVRRIYVVSLTNLGGKEVLDWEEGTNYSLHRIREYNSCLKELSEKFDCTFINVEDVLSSEDLADGLHPNSRGYDKLAERIIPRITE